MLLQRLRECGGEGNGTVGWKEAKVYYYYQKCQYNDVTIPHSAVINAYKDSSIVLPMIQ